MATTTTQKINRATTATVTKGTNTSITISNNSQAEWSYSFTSGVIGHRLDPDDVLTGVTEANVYISNIDGDKDLYIAVTKL